MRLVASMFQGAERLPNLPTGSFTLESFYEGRAQMQGTSYLIDIRCYQPALPALEGFPSPTQPGVT
jgi:hypothetical protein